MPVGTFLFFRILIKSCATKDWPEKNWNPVEIRYEKEKSSQDLRKHLRRRALQQLLTAYLLIVGIFTLHLHFVSAQVEIMLTTCQNLATLRIHFCGSNWKKGLIQPCCSIISQSNSSSYCTKNESFPLWISSVNVANFAGNCVFGHIYWRNP